MRSHNESELVLSPVYVKFLQLLPLYKRFSEKIHSLLEDALAERSLEYHKIESRVKEADSFFRKIKTHKSKYKSPLEDVPDIVGARVIVSFDQDLEAVESLLSELFAINWPRSERKRDTMPDDRFGYLSNHYFVNLNPKRAELPEWKPYAGMHAEVQVRTVVQTAWAVASHKLAYKLKMRPPRRLFAT